MSNFIAGLDLAAVRDYSALAIVERIEVASDDVRCWSTGEPYMVPDQHYFTRFLKRWERGTDPGVVVDDVADLLDEPGLRGDCLLRYDATGMGVGVRSILEDRWRQGRFWHKPSGVTITSGAASQNGNVPKVDLVSTLVRLQRERRLHQPPGLKSGEQLRRELFAFQVKVTAAGNERYEAQTESVHDDMVMALALAVWGKPRRHAEPRRWAPEELAGAVPQQ